ncbi:MAG: hypothetical protein KJO29_11880, partial [Bacteroidia bacterium]|nr:hypothetical protein [Bacteroidia bacterium]
QRAKPGADLFSRIEQNIEAPGARLIPMRQWSYGIAAAVIILVLNVFAFRQITEYNQSNNTEMLVSGESDESLFSNYNIYER